MARKGGLDRQSVQLFFFEEELLLLSEDDESEDDEASSEDDKASSPPAGGNWLELAAGQRLWGAVSVTAPVLASDFDFFALAFAHRCLALADCLAEKH